MASEGVHDSGRHQHGFRPSGDDCEGAKCIASERDADLRLCLWESEGAPLRLVLEAREAPPRSACVMVGPEGGLTADEVATARRAGYTPVTLGHRILRTETAALTIVALLQYTLGDLGGDGP